MSSVELLQKACFELKSLLQNPTFSSVYKTKAMYVKNQPDFYNMAAIGFVPDDYSPFELLKKINHIEAKYGRDRSKEIRFGQRSLDIDIELFGNQTICDPILEIPHPRCYERAFVLIPSLEILNDSADEYIRRQWEKYLSELFNNNQGKDVKLYLPKEKLFDIQAGNSNG